MTVIQENTAPTGTFAGGIDNYTVGAAPTATRTLSLSVDYLRTDADRVGGEVHELHGEVRELDLNDRTLEKGKKNVAGLLDELAYERGMGWSDIAELAGVSVSAVRKWRKGGDASPESRSRLARIAALLDVLEEKGLVEDPAGWMAMDLPLEAGHFIRPFDLYLDGHAVALLDLAERRKTMTQVLDEVRPEWRQERTGFVVFTDTDGQRSMRLRSE